MNGEQLRKGFWTEQDIEDARRLLRVLDERSKNRLAGGLKGPAEIHDPAQSLLDEWPEAGNTVGGIAASGLTVAGGARDGLEKFERAGLQVTDYVSEKISPKETARPASGRLLDGEDRAVTRSRGCK